MSELIETMQDEYQGFQITDDSKAEWAIRKIKEAQSDTEKWNAHFAHQLEGIKKANDATIEYMTTLLSGYFASVPHKETKTQSKYELPSATLIRKQQQPQYERDDDALLAYLHRNDLDDLVRVKVEPDWANVKKRATVHGETLVDTETGEVIDGVRVIARPDVFDVKLKEE